MCLLLTASTPTLASAQSSCLGSDDTAAMLIGGVRDITSNPDRYDDRVLYQLPTLTEAETGLVSSDSLCAAASDAINAASGIYEQRDVYLITAGDRFVVVDPSIHGGEPMLVWIFTSEWEYLALFAN